MVSFEKMVQYHQTEELKAQRILEIEFEYNWACYAGKALGQWKHFIMAEF